MNDQPKNLLIVEDHALLARRLTGIVETFSHSAVGPVATLAEADALIASPDTDIDAVLTDLTLSDGDAWGHIVRWRERGLPCLVITGQMRPPASSKHGDVPWLLKPFDIEELDRAIDQLFAENPTN